MNCQMRDSPRIPKFASKLNKCRSFPTHVIILLGLPFLTKIICKFNSILIHFLTDDDVYNNAKI